MRRLRLVHGFAPALLLTVASSTWAGCNSDDAKPGPTDDPDGSAIDAPTSETSTDDGGTTDVVTADTSTEDASADAQGDAPSDAPADAPPDVVPGPNDLYVDPTGSDTNPGTSAAPFKTIGAAVAAVDAGSKIVWLKDGTWNGTVEPALDATNAAGPCSGTGVMLPSGVQLRALNAGAATIDFKGNHALCTNGNVVNGVTLNRSGGGGVAVAAVSGTSSLEGVFMSGIAAGVSAPVVTVTNGAHLDITPGALTSYTSSIGAFATVTGAGAELNINGGALDDANPSAISGAAVIGVTGGKLVLTNLLVERPLGNQNATSMIGVNASGGIVELRGTTTIRGFNNAHGLFLSNAANVTITDDAVVRNNLWGVFASTSNATPVTLKLQGSASIRNNTNAGIRGDFINGHKLDVTIEGNALITANGSSGVEFSAGTFTMNGGSVTDNGQYGVQLLSALTGCSIKNATITGNAFAGVALDGTGTATLGTMAAPGGNTLKDNGAGSFPNLLVNRTGVTAVGNTWNAAQGADANGNYGGTLEAVGIVATGANYQIPNAGDTLKLAGP